MVTTSPDDPLAVAAVQAIHGGDVEALTRLLVAHPALATARLGTEPAGEGPGMTRTLLHVATDSKALGHCCIGTEHVLLGLMDLEGVAGRALGDLGVSPDVVRAQLAAMLDVNVERLRTQKRPRRRRALRSSDR